jgi:hypothetical protein
MHTKALPLMLLITACGQAAENGAASNEMSVTNSTAAPIPPPSPEPDYANMDIPVPAPGEPGGLPDDRTPVSEAPFTPESAQGAANVVQTYFALLTERKYQEALALWQKGADTPKMPDFGQSLDRYARLGANIGAPGRLDPGAGQVYVEVPVQFYGRLKTGAVVNMLGSATLHRVNDVDGSTAEQRRWHIVRIDLKKTP